MASTWEGEGGGRKEGTNEGRKKERREGRKERRKITYSCDATS